MSRHLLVIPLALAACSTLRTEESGTTPDSNDFYDASEESGVPVEILMGIARAETRLQMIQGEEEFDGQAIASGIMALRGEKVELAAALIGVDPDDVRTDSRSNIRAAAALLATRAQDLGIDTDDLAAWAPVVAEYSDIVDEEGVAEYVYFEVYAAIASGISMEDFELPPTEVTPDWPRPKNYGLRTGDAGAIWTPSPNYNSRSGASVDFVIVHTCEGTYSGCWSWLTNGASGVSAHYVVNDTGSEVRQLVDEDDRAWHISASYDCANNSSVECWRNGTSMNTISVGIEHAGYASQSSWDPGLISRSADLARGVADRHGIPKDSYHIVGHGKLQPWNRSDPGAAWPWTDYLNKIQSGAGGGGGGGGTSPGAGSGVTGQFVIDSNNAANDVANYYVQVSGSWWASANVAGYYNTGYWVAPTEAVSDPASFWFYDAGSTCYTVEAWWPAAADRSPAITWMGWDAANAEVGRKTVNQRIDGGKWNVLGDWRFGPGWNRVLLSRWTTGGSYAVADAVRLTPSTNCP